MATVRSRIKKGRDFQKRVLEKIKECFVLDDDDCRTPVGCETGCDIKFTKDAKKIVGLGIECKDKKSLSIFAAIEQAKANCEDGVVEAVIFKRGDIGPHKTYICVPLDHYLDVRRRLMEP